MKNAFKLFDFKICYYSEVNIYHTELSIVYYDFEDIPLMLSNALAMKDNVKYPNFSMWLLYNPETFRTAKEAAKLASKYVELFCKEHNLIVTRDDYYSDSEDSYFTISKSEDEIPESDFSMEDKLNDFIAAFLKKLTEGLFEND